ncbi:cell division protein FtsQ [Paenibacillus contaminans]|uniref:Cell division protein DivIB n=1 Tax=Paenibacillus contaminans TaxID=450362 RepID=A0A329MIM2_9BACL|nr:cell division protein FtsQ [Paenibacillus contaminans]
MIRKPFLPSCVFRRSMSRRGMAGEGVRLSAAEPKVPAMKPESKKRRGSRALLILLVLFFVTVLIILFFQSPVSKLSEIEISGNELVSSETIGQASAVAVGDQFFAFSSGEVEKRIKKLPMIESVEVTKSFPGHMSIVVKEYPRVAFQFTSDGSVQVLLVDGSSTAVPVSGIPFDKPILSGWSDDDPLKLKLLQTLADIPPAILSDVSEIKPDPSDAYADKIKMYTRSQFEVSTTIGYLPEKLPYLGYMINSLKDQNKTSGVISMFEQVRGEAIPLDTGAKDTKKAGDTKKNDNKKEPTPKTTPKPTPTPTKSATPKPKPTPTQRDVKGN